MNTHTRHLPFTGRSRRAALLLGALGLLSCLPAAFAELVFEDTTFEYRAGLADERAEAVFRFRNAGESPVTIRRLNSSCGCTVPELDKDTYAPGESGEIRALFTFGNRVGRQEKRISVETDEGGSMVRSLSFITHIPQWGALQPQMLRWGLEDTPVARELRLTLPGTVDVRIERVSTDLQHFTVAEVRSSATEVVYSVTPKTAGERVTERLVVTLVASVGEQERTRELVTYCLIR